MEKQLVSLCVLARNEEKSINKAITSLERQILPEGYESELIVVVSGSTDRTAKIVRELQKNYSNIKLFEPKEVGKAHAWNIAKDAAKSDTLIFSDGDVVTKRDAVKEILAEFKRNPKMELLSAKIVPLTGKKLLSKAVALRYKSQFTVSGDFYGVKRGAIKSILIPKHIILDDWYVAFKVGLEKTGICSKSIVFVKIPTNFKEALEQRARISAGFRQLKKELEIKRIPGNFKRLIETYNSLTPKERIREFPIWVLLRLLGRAKASIDPRQKKLPWKPIRSSKI